MEVDVDVRGGQRAVDLVSRLSRRLEDGTPAMRGLVDQLTEAESERFAGRGQRWRKLAASTLRWRRDKGHGTRPLVVTGELMRSLTVLGHPKQIVRVGPTSLTFGTSVFYARFHQRGTKHEPKRTVLGLTRQQKASIVTALRDLLLEDKK